MLKPIRLFGSCCRRRPVSISATGSITPSDRPSWIWMPRRTVAPGIPWKRRWTAGSSHAFHLDAGIGDAVMPPVEVIECRDWLGFAGIGAPLVQTISREQQWAEKLHARE